MELSESKYLEIRLAQLQRQKKEAEEKAKKIQKEIEKIQRKLRQGA